MRFVTLSLCHFVPYLPHLNTFKLSTWTVILRYWFRARPECMG